MDSRSKKTRFAFALAASMVVVFAVRPAWADDAARRRVERAKFSPLRLVVEIVAGAAAGALVGYGVAAATDEPIAGLVANVAVTPVAVWGTGEAMGGDGSLLYTYMGGLAGFSGSSSDSALAFGVVVAPIGAAVVYEASSHFTAKSREYLVGIGVAPVFRAARMEGFVLGLALHY